MHKLLRMGIALVCAMVPASLLAQSEITIDAKAGQTVISRDIYGQFAEHLGHGIYEGLWVGINSSIPNTRGIRNDVVAALKAVKIPLIRWPGGCFADEYHWMDGIGVPEKRPEMINTNWGGVTEDNSFGTHEFMDLCAQVGAEAYISGNLGSGTVRELSQWIEYMTSPGKSPMTDLRKQNGRQAPWKIRYLGLGNEAWGCGGNMKPEFYTQVMRQFNAYVKNFPGNDLQRIASGASDADFHWTETVMKEGSGILNGVSLHYYTLQDGWDHKGSATRFAEPEWFQTMSKTLEMDSLVARHSAIMDKYDPAKKIGLMVDEWGNWFDVEPGTNPGFLFQQNSLRDALVAGTNLNIFNNHSDRVKMTCIAQMINVLQALILTSGKEMVLTPTYFVYQMYAAHQNAKLLPLVINSAEYQFEGKRLTALNASSSMDKDGKIHVTVCNIDPNKEIPLRITLKGAKYLQASGARVLTAAKLTDFNEFGKKASVVPVPFSRYEISGNKILLTIPARSVLEIECNDAS